MERELEGWRGRGGGRGCGRGGYGMRVCGRGEGGIPGVKDPDIQEIVLRLEVFCFAVHPVLMRKG